MAAPKPLARIGHQGGVNLTLAYVLNGRTLAYRLRCSAISHGVQMIGDESAARTHRAFYPHRPTPARFALTVDLLGRKRTLGDGRPGPLGSEHTEYERFNVWMANYMRLMLAEDEFAPTTTFPEMIVTCPVRNFYRWGIPLGPIEFGDHVGSMLWRQTITFETTREPNDKPVGRSRFDANGTQKDYNAKHFYPTGGQLSGDQAPSMYDPVIRTTDDPLPTVDAVQAAVSGPLPGSEFGGYGGGGSWGSGAGTSTSTRGGVQA